MHTHIRATTCTCTQTHACAHAHTTHIHRHAALPGVFCADHHTQTERRKWQKSLRSRKRTCPWSRRRPFLPTALPDQNDSTHPLYWSVCEISRRTHLHLEMCCLCFHVHRHQYVHLHTSRHVYKYTYMTHIDVNLRARVCIDISTRICTSREWAERPIAVAANRTAAAGSPCFKYDVMLWMIDWRALRVSRVVAPSPAYMPTFRSPKASTSVTPLLHSAAPTPFESGMFLHVTCIDACICMSVCAHTTSTHMCIELTGLGLR
jgi:hypothetical protein